MQPLQTKRAVKSRADFAASHPVGVKRLPKEEEAIPCLNEYLYDETKFSFNVLRAEGIENEEDLSPSAVVQIFNSFRMEITEEEAVDVVLYFSCKGIT